MGKGFLCGLTRRPVVIDDVSPELPEMSNPPVQQPDYLSEANPVPLVADNGLAKRLRALAPKPVDEKARREAFCRLLHRVERDATVSAIAEQIAAGNTSARVYALSDQIAITEGGAFFMHGRTMLSASALSILNVSDSCPLDFDCSPAALTTMEADMAKRIVAIGADLVEQFSHGRGSV